MLGRALLLAVLCVALVSGHPQQADQPSPIASRPDQMPAHPDQPAAPPLQRPLEPAGEILQGRPAQIAEGSLPLTFVRSPDADGPDGKGRYLVAVNSGYGVQFTAEGNVGQELLQVIDLAAAPPLIVQAVYFPSPQSAALGAVFGPRQADGSWPLYVSGGVQDVVWRLTFTAGADQPLSPTNDARGLPLAAPRISLKAAWATLKSAAIGRRSLYALGLARSADGRQLYVAANLADALVIVDPDRPERARAVSLADRHRRKHHVYPYAALALTVDGHDRVYVSCWNDASVVVVDPRRRKVVERIRVGTHPNALAATADGSTLIVSDGNGDTVTFIDTAKNRVRLTVPVGLEAPVKGGNSPQALALSADGTRLYVTLAQVQAVAVVRLEPDSLRGPERGESDDDDDPPPQGGENEHSDATRVIGYVPTARYPSAIAVVSSTLIVANGKGEPPPRGNVPTADFPANDTLRGAYSVALMRSSIRAIPEPGGDTLAAATRAVMRSNGLLGEPVTRLFDGPSPIAHVIYVIKENRTYDQVFGDLASSGDGTPADGDPRLALLGNGEAAARPDGRRQAISPNHHALARRFGVFDRFFVNAEASPDGHNWSTAAVSTDYVDRVFRWNYSRRGRTYDFEGFNRLPDYEPPSALPPVLKLPVTAPDVVAFIKRFVPYLNGSRDASEPDSLYLWDAAARAGLTYRSYGEYVGTLSEDDVRALNARKRKRYPDISPTVGVIPTKRALEGHACPGFRSFDLWTPDAFTVDSYRAARASGADPVIRAAHDDARFRGMSRLGVWLDEFERAADDLTNQRGDHLPALTILRLPNDHTAGLLAGHPTPQFMMADNDYALGRVVQAVSHSLYWRSTAIVVVEDDAQDGPDHVDAHRSVALVVSAWNRPGQLVHAVHNTVSLVRTIELLLGIPPMNTLDAQAVPMDVFQGTPDLTPYDAVLPEVADDNLVFVKPRTPRERAQAEATEQQDLENPDMADPATLNAAIWYSVRGDTPMPAPARWAGADVMRLGTGEEEDDVRQQPLYLAHVALQRAVEEAGRR